MAEELKVQRKTDPRYDPAQRPRPTNYRAEATFNRDNWAGCGQGTLTCTKCSTVLRTDLCPEDLVDPERCLEYAVTKHNRDFHVGLLSVFTSAGWLYVSDLFPVDPAYADRLAEQALNSIHK